jgi:hypothetical protein
MRTVLSTNGSDRATGYNISSKLIRQGDTLYAGWLDAPTEPGQPSTVKLGICDVASRDAADRDAATGSLLKTIQLGEGIDNHCGPALALDPNGRLHAVIGAHHGPFLYRWSDDPADEAAWSKPEPLGPADTYPSLAVDASGTLHLAYREKADRWQLWYRRKRPGSPWEAPRALAISPTFGYNHFMQTISVGPSGTLHLTFQFHYAESGRAEDCTGRAACYLRSGDGGDTWHNENQLCSSLPLTVETVQAICRYPDGGLRVGNHMVDAEDRPWLFTSLPDKPSGALWHRIATGWEAIDLAPALGGLNVRGGRATSMALDDRGQIHLALATHPDGQETTWYDPSLELFHLTLNAAGQAIALEQLTDTDPTVAHWLPALEQWDWTRPDADPAGGLWIAYTSGLNAGGIWGDNRNALSTEVYLQRLQPLTASK